MFFVDVNTWNISFLSFNRLYVHHWCLDYKKNGLRSYFTLLIYFFYQDMKALVLDVFHKKSMKPFGRVEIYDILELNATNPINKYVYLYTCNRNCWNTVFNNIAWENRESFPLIEYFIFLGGSLCIHILYNLCYLQLSMLSLNLKHFMVCFNSAIKINCFVEKLIHLKICHAFLWVWQFMQECSIQNIYIQKIIVKFYNGTACNYF